VTAYLGFEVFEGEYKVMGLSPYGKPRYLHKMHELIELLSDGQYRLRMEYFDFLHSDHMFSPQLCELFGRPPRDPESEIDEFAQDIARSLQVFLEDILLAKTRYLHSRVQSDNLCMAGGVALNCVANARILREGPFKRLFVQPASSDAGGCLGAAAIAHLRLTGEAPVREPLRHVYLGPSSSSEEVAHLLAAAPVSALDFRNREDKLVQEIANRLAAGQVVGWMHGRSEFGPRSLGARSILADPRQPDMRDRINALVKMREGFRPFAPAVLATKAAEHFDLDHASPFMLETCAVISPLPLPAITHVDGSARVQTVHDDTSPRFAALLRAFESKTGCPILLNTSFNVRGEPIVCRPIDAILCFIRSDIDCLVLEDFVLDRAGLPESWLSWFHHTRPSAPSAVNHSVYTFL
jgi:carbamoyltransferase